MDCHKPRMWLGFRNDEGEKNECYIKRVRIEKWIATSLACGSAFAMTRVRKMNVILKEYVN